MAPENVQVIHLKLPNAARRRLYREASKGQSSSRDLQKSQNLPITPRRVRQLLHESSNLVYRNWKTAPALTAEHKKMRVDCVKKKVTWTKEKWETVVFSDEKKFNLDGPDSFQCYWHNLWKEKQLFSKRLFGEGSIMVWGTFSAFGKADLVVMEGNKTLFDISVCWKKDFPFMNRLDTNNTNFNWITQPYTFLSSRKTDLKQKILKF